jgi:hypothetical protein
MACHAPDTIANWFDDPDKADRSGVIPAVCRAEDGLAQPVWAEPAGVQLVVFRDE